MADFDVRQGLKDVLKKFEKILYELGLIADYVVEIGSDEIWSWKKWASGDALLFGRRRVATSGNYAAWGSCYYKTIAGINYPFEFIDIPEQQTSVATPAGSLWAVPMRNSAVATGNMYAIRPQNTSDQFSVDVHYSVCGKWKSGGG